MVHVHVVYTKVNAIGNIDLRNHKRVWDKIETRLC